MSELNNIVLPEELPPPMVTCVIEGILEEADLRELMLSTADADTPVEEDDPTDLRRIKEKHHSVARLIANGMQQRMVAKLCGYNESYLSVLLNNPAMVDLVEMYRIQNGSAQQVVMEKLRTVGLQAVEKLQQQIEDDKLNNQELLGVAKLGLDRGGYGPASKQHVVNESHVIDHAELTRLNNDARKRSQSQIVPSHEVRKALAPPQKEEGVHDAGE